jgi:hypothetical protein
VASPDKTPRPAYADGRPIPQTEQEACECGLFTDRNGIRVVHEPTCPGWRFHPPSEVEPRG